VIFYLLRNIMHNSKNSLQTFITLFYLLLASCFSCTLIFAQCNIINPTIRRFVNEVIHLHCSFSMKVLDKQTMFMHSQKNMIGGGHKFVIFLYKWSKVGGEHPSLMRDLLYTFKNKLCTFVPQTVWSWVWGVKIETKMNIKAFAFIWWWLFFCSLS